MAKEKTEEQLWMLDVRTKQGKSIYEKAKQFIRQRDRVKAEKVKRDTIAVELVSLVRDSDLKAIDSIGTIEFEIDGVKITVKPGKDSLSVRELVAGDDE